MRETKNLKLTQFDPNDIPNWLDQYNSDMEKIDTANISQSTTNAQYESRFDNDEELIRNNRAQINENTQDIANIKENVNNIKGGSTTSIADLESEVNTVSQSLTTLKGGSTKTIAELESDLADDKTALDSLDARVGTLEDTVTTLSGSVSKIGTNLTTFKSVSVPNGVSETLITTITIDTENKTGHYFANVNALFDENENGIRQIVFKRTRNVETIDVGVANNHAVSSVKTNLNLSTVPFDAKLNDVFELYAEQTSNTDINVIGTISLFRLRE